MPGGPARRGAPGAPLACRCRLSHLSCGGPARRRPDVHGRLRRRSPGRVKGCVKTHPQVMVAVVLEGPRALRTPARAPKTCHDEIDGWEPGSWVLGCACGHRDTRSTSAARCWSHHLAPQDHRAPSPQPRQVLPMSGTPHLTTHTTCTNRSPRAAQSTNAPGNAETRVANAMLTVDRLAAGRSTGDKALPHVSN